MTSLPTPDRSSGISSPIDLVARLLAALDAAEIRYCHWKSNEALDRSASGENDLDVLVARADASKFAGIARGIGFTTARAAAHTDLPGLIDFYGFDEPSGRVVHIHCHLQLVLGDDTTKNYRLPIEEPYLESVHRLGPFPVPSPEFEYLVFVPRMALKHCPWDVLLSRKGRLTPSERRELAWLEERIDPAEVERIRHLHLPFIDDESWAMARAALEREAGFGKRAVAGRRIQSVLAANGRTQVRWDVAGRLWSRAIGRFRRRMPGYQPRRRPEAGGMIVAVLGADGSGKSSAVEMIYRELCHDIWTVRFHMGKPQRSLLTRVVRRAMRRPRAAGRLAATSQPAWELFTTFPGYGFMVWHYLTARDRYREYSRIRRVTGGGAVAVCDRFPTNWLHTMDGPRLQYLPGLDQRRLARWLATREAGFYRRILPPDLAIVLRVPPEIAAVRRSEQDTEFVERRAGEVWDVDWSASGAVVIDAAGPIDEVHTAVRAAVWGVL